MSIKITGAEWNRFYGDDAAWPDGGYLEFAELLVDGVAFDADNGELTSFPEHAEVTLLDGWMFKSERDASGKSLVPYFKAWRKKQNTVFFTCSAPKDLSEALKAAILAAGGKVHGL